MSDQNTTPNTEATNNSAESKKTRVPRNTTVYVTREYAEKFKPQNNVSTKLWECAQTETADITIELEDGSRQTFKGRLVFKAQGEDGKEALVTTGYCWSVFAPEALDCISRQFTLHASGAYARQPRGSAPLSAEKKASIIAEAKPEELVGAMDEEKLKAMQKAIAAQLKKAKTAQGS